MAAKRGQQVATDEELLNAIDSIGNDSVPTKAAPKSSKGPKPPVQSEQDLLAELDNLAAERPVSRPHTPRPQSSASKRANAASGTTPASSTRTSEEKAQANASRKSGESGRSFHTSLTPGTSQSAADNETGTESQASWEVPASAQQDGSAGGGWWGGIFATASAAVKTAEAAVKEIQQNEEAKRWAEQVKGNVGALRGLGM